MDQDDSRSKYGKSVIQRLDDFKLLNRDSIIVHGSYLSDEDLDILAERKCVIAVNPSSNMNNGVGLPDIRKMKEHGVPVMLGNDGMSGGIAAEWQFLILGMHHRYQDPVSVGLDDLLEIINNGYDYINRQLGVKTGRIEAGYEADLQLVDYMAPTPLNGENCLGHLFFGNAYSHRPSHVWTKGIPALTGYRHIGDAGSILAETGKAAEEVWKRLQ